MSFRLATASRLAALLGLVVSAAIGCSSADGGPLGDPLASEDGGADTGSSDDAGSSDDSGSGDEDTGGGASDSGAPSSDSGGTTADTGGGFDAGDGWPEAYADLEAQILAETNKRRAAGADCRTKGKFGPAGPLTMHPLLTLAARKHSKDMATKNYFAHDNLAGQSPFDRMKAEGYKGTTMGENIAAGNSTVAKTMDQWMNSDGHCANIMNPKYTQLGVGYFYTSTSKYKHYWTQNFGAGG